MFYHVLDIDQEANRMLYGTPNQTIILEAPVTWETIFSNFVEFEIKLLKFKTLVSMDGSLQSYTMNTPATREAVQWLHRHLQDCVIYDEDVQVTFSSISTLFSYVEIKSEELWEQIATTPVCQRWWGQGCTKGGTIEEQLRPRRWARITPSIRAQNQVGS
ncbi:hypothetical protein Pelo_14780 [Pelomyxa schiedti]|nr:hypothetical protein Pelo_14780 [Pelomyxa schiedti]